jgi:hypothetical protein
MKPSTSLKTYLTPLKPYATLLLYVMGLAVCCSVIFFDYWFSSTEPRHHKFLHYYQSQLWLLLLVVQTVFWFAALVPIYRIRNFLKSEYEARRKTKLEGISVDGQGKGQGEWMERRLWLILASLLLLILVWLLLQTSSFLSPNCGDYNFPHSSEKTRILTSIGFGIALIAAVELLLIGIELAKTLEMGGSSADRISKYITLRRSSLRLLTILGVMTGLAMVGLGAKRNAILQIKECDFLPEHVFLHALYLSVLLALVFFPTYAALLRTGRKLVRDLLPMPQPTEESWPNWYSRQKSLEELLQLSVTENLRAGIAILAPIVGSLISLLK